MKVFSFRNIRIIILLFLLAIAAIYTKEQRLNTRLWFKPVEVTIFPINGDGSKKTEQYIHSLDIHAFQSIDTFFARHAKQFQLITPQPIVTVLGSTINTPPPSPPADRNSMFEVMIWSLKLRYWAYINTPDNHSNKNRIRLFILYFQGKKGQALAHSLGMQKGLIGVIHAFAHHSQNRQNAVIMAHEILHTVGATDKYHLQNNQPVYPDGYAQPDKKPLYPQHDAEIMAGRIPVTSNRSVIPKDLRFCVVGEQTAKEINWISTR